MAVTSRTGIFLVVAGLTVLAGCEEGMQSPFASRSNAGAEPTVEPEEAAVTVVEKDVEAPDVFGVNEAGLWDGRPSLGGVWVAHPEVADPERVMIRNEANGKFVVGALFRRERNNPGPRIQVSSDAAAELGMLAGQPTTLDIVALRRETVEIPVDVPAEEVEADTAEEATETAGDGIETATLDPVATASAAIEEAAPAAVAAAATETTAAPAPAASSDLRQPYIQIGIFSVEENAQNTATSLRTAGVIPTVRETETQGKASWRVVVGPATSAAERKKLLAKVREMGFEDAYYVTN